MPDAVFISRWPDPSLLRRLVDLNRPGIVSFRTFAMIVALGAAAFAALLAVQSLRFECSTEFSDLAALCEERNVHNASMYASVAGGAGMVAALLFAWWLFARRTHPALAALRDRPREVCWVYFQRARGTVSFLEIGLADRQRFSLWVGGLDESLLAAAFAQVTPAATFGYSGEIEARFLRDPRSLLRA